MKRTYLCLAAILLLHASIGALGEAWFWHYFPDGGSQGDWMINPALYWIPLLSLVFVWCRVDAHTRRVEFSIGQSIFVSFLFPVGVPYYFYRTYSWRDSLVHISLFVAFVGACIVTLLLGRKLVFQYYAAWTNA